MRKKLFKSLVAVCASIGMLATSMSAFAAESYTVQSGDYLKKIAKQIYGDASKWEVIYEANKDSIKNPNLIYEGQVFMIPDLDVARESGAETPAPESGTETPVPASETEAPVSDPAADTPAAAPAVPAIASLPIPTATVRVEKGGGSSFDGRSIWTQTYDTGSKMTGGHIGWEGELLETVVESTDTYGVTYRSYAFKNLDPAKNTQSAKDALADYMVANPDSGFTALVKESGSEIVIITYPALFPDGIEGCKKYPDINLLASDSFIVDGKLHILCADLTFDWLEGTPRPDLYIPQCLDGEFKYLSNLLR